MTQADLSPFTVVKKIGYLVMRTCAALSLLLGLAVRADALDSLMVRNLSVGGFVDAYYVYDIAKPPSRDRSFTTQPLRHNEFNLNLGLIDLKYASEKAHGRVALQTGTYVQSNYAAEPGLLQNIHEASAGFSPDGAWWFDMGIFASHIGCESAISRDNYNYSRSLMAEYSPYYEAGLRLSGPVSPKATLGLLVVNGWQNIRETNGDKAVGTQLQVKPNDAVLFNWSTFIGNEAPDNVAKQTRIFNDFYVQARLAKDVESFFMFDVGFQKRPTGGYARWYSPALVMRFTVSPSVKIGTRVEYYADREQVIVATGTPNGFQTFGASVNLDYAVSDNFLFRVEGRGFRSKDRVFPSSKGPRDTDGFVTMSFALSL
jgi:hypothetical protein